MKDREEIQLVLTRLNDAWSKGAVEDIPTALDDCLAEGVVFRGPEFQLLSGDKQACIQSYVDFLRQAKVLEFEQDAPQIDVNGATAVAACPWKMTYQLGTETYTEQGHDLLVLSRADGRWRIVWRAMFAKPA